jgi:hypothetical protein
MDAGAHDRKESNDLAHITSQNVYSSNRIPKNSKNELKNKFFQTRNPSS